MFSFSITDDLTHWETPDGAIRVHYSLEGPNQVNLFDGNNDDVPDFVERVAEIAQASLSTFRELNLLAPADETQFTLSDNGGSDALDFYLVDFGGNADGQFGIDACDNNDRCTGHMVIENDFLGYSYSNYTEGLSTVVPHELFHGVQAAYTQALPRWISEGTAVWAQRRYDLESRDFRRFANTYLGETSRPLNKPPSGPVQAFAYGSCIWWEFLTLRHGVDLMEDLMTAWQPLEEDAEMVSAMVELLQARGDSMTSIWPDFAAYNLGTGSRAGILESYPDAPLLSGINITEQAESITFSNRFYPLTINYYLVDHTGGPLYWAMAKESPNLLLSLYPAASTLGDVERSIDLWASDTQEPYALVEGESLRSGTYWLVVMNPTTSGNSVYTDICLGSLAIAESCIPEEEPEEPTTNGEVSDPSDQETGDEDTSSGCQQATHPSLWLLLFGLFFWNHTSQKSRTLQTH
jgi:hypothetical protein